MNRLVKLVLILFCCVPSLLQDHLVTCVFLGRTWVWEDNDETGWLDFWGVGNVCTVVIVCR